MVKSDILRTLSCSKPSAQSCVNQNPASQQSVFERTMCVCSTVCLFSHQALVSLKLCGNEIVTLPPPSKWKCSHLRTLDLARNQLGKYVHTYCTHCLVWVSCYWTTRWSSINVVWWNIQYVVFLDILLCLSINLEKRLQYMLVFLDKKQFSLRFW